MSFAAALLLTATAAATPTSAMRGPVSLEVRAPGVSDAPLHVRVFLPEGHAPDCGTRFPALYVNDGQDAEAVALASSLRALAGESTIRPVVAVAIDAPAERHAAYGLSERAAGRSDVGASAHGAIGDRAHAYSEWMAHTLVPLIDARFCTRAVPDGRAVLGWSLGGLHAFNMGWQYPDVFGRVGALSPSLWVAGERDTPADAQRTRLAHRRVDAGASRTRPGARFFFSVGTAEEADDRDGDGTIDAVDDVRDLVEGTPGEAPLKGLRQQVFSINDAYASRPGRADVALQVVPAGRHDRASWREVLPAFLRWAFAVHAPPLQAIGTVESWQDVPSAHIAARHIDVWLPPGYARQPRKRYPVLYMHDGQNLFDPALSYTGIDWDIDGAMTRLIAEDRVREAIVVGIWNTPRRFAEYMPRAPIVEAGDALPPGIPAGTGDELLSDAYLRFLVEELKPFIDRTYRTRPGREDTLIMGSSMGGLISLYAASEYPDVFGGVGAVSTHWPAGDGIVIHYLRRRAPDPATHRIYFDHGTAALDADYPPYQARMDAVMRELGYVEGRNWVTRVFEGAEHNERAWRDRLDVPLTFLLGTPDAP